MNVLCVLSRSLSGGRFLGSGPRAFSLSWTDTRNVSTDSAVEPKKSYKLLVVGGGTGGCSIAAKFCNSLGAGKVGIIEPADKHYYQPLWTLVGGGIHKASASERPMKDVLPAKCDWIKEKAVSFDPENCTVSISNGDTVKYDYLVVAMGLQNDFHKVKGLPEALATDPRVCSNFSRETVVKTWPALQAFQGGNAIFTFPNTTIKCAGAPQKIMYLAEHYFRKTGKRDKANIMYNTSLPVIFGVKKYAARLREICEKRNIAVNYRSNLIEVKPDTSEAVFADLDSCTGATHKVKYDLLHASPPMSTPDALKQSPLVDATGFVDINKGTMQHVKYPNVFGLGDCTNSPTSKTAAAVASQSGVLRQNLTALFEGKPFHAEYTGYTSCPLVTGYGKCILAEFDYSLEPMETFPFDQGKERRSMYHMKSVVLPAIYWTFMLKGHWEGPSTYRNIMRLGMGTITKADKGAKVAKSARA